MKCSCIHSQTTKNKQTACNRASPTAYSTDETQPVFLPEKPMYLSECPLQTSQFDPKVPQPAL